MQPACCGPDSMCERFSIGWGTNRWRRPCDIWYRRAMFTTDLIRLLYPKLPRAQIRFGNPFNRKSPAKGAFVTTIDSLANGILREHEPSTRKMFLDLSAILDPNLQHRSERFRLKPSLRRKFR